MKKSKLEKLGLELYEETLLQNLVQYTVNLFQLAQRKW